MADTGSDRTLEALLELEEDALDRSPRSQSNVDGRSSLPTLNERVEMYLRAVHGSEHVATADARAAAREQMLSAMAADLADGPTRLMFQLGLLAGRVMRKLTPAPVFSGVGA